MAINIIHESRQKENNDDRDSQHDRDYGGHGGYGRGNYGGGGRHGGRGGYDESFGKDSVVDNHGRNDHNVDRKDHFIEEGRGERRERRRDCDDRCDDRERFFDDGRCCPKDNPPVVPAPVVAVAGGTTVIGAFPCTTVVQILNNAALLATYSLVLQPLQKCDTGFIVVETAEGITLLTVTGASNVSPSALTTAGSYLILKWNGFTWVQI